MQLLDESVARVDVANIWDSPAYLRLSISKDHGNWSFHTLLIEMFIGAIRRTLEWMKKKKDRGSYRDNLVKGMNM